MSTIEYEALSHALAQLGLHQSAAEYHGALCGLICAGAPLRWDLGLATEDAQATGATAEAGQALLKDLATQVEADLAAEDMPFAPLLPDDDADIAERADALGDWCQGVLFGIACKPGLQPDALSDDAQEMIRDLTEIARAKAGDGAGGDASEASGEQIDEGAYAELVEYVRVGAQLFFFEFRAGDALAADETLH